ncbi:hypothetical protein OIU85_003238 [Salix viminalis]|uniref:Transmembrane protein n=1 Tax=Salix viminalis TaxID=40686 RepID=A0A6N2LV11_SALVM|nr:hypothetical protein OIU85_003238 [Salix viminalis]
MYKNPHSHDTPSPLPNPKIPPPLPPLIHRHELRLRRHHNKKPTMFSPPYRLMVATRTWLRTGRSRCVFLLLLSPILLPILCATLPLLCVAELCIRFCHRVRRKKDEDGGDRLRRCEEGFCDCDCEEEEEKEVGLLQRYLEDQLRLVGSVYECGDEFDHLDDGDDQADHDHNLNTPLLG